MNSLILLSILLSAALGIARGADLAFGTDAVTGLCTVGSVWWRYAALGAVVLAAVLIGRHCAGKAETVRSRQPLAGVLAFAGAVCFLAAAGAQLAVGLSATSSFVRSILECICAVWLSTLGRCWLTHSGWKKPTGGLYLAVAGSVLFYWNVLMRFMENSSSWHRVAPTVVVWQMLAALVFLSALGPALSLPDTADSRTLCASGLTVWALCLCWEFPQLLDTLLRGGVLARLPDFFFGLGLCCIGVLGGICAVRTTRTESERKSARHSVG